MKIITTHVYPPIPIRSMDWAAHFDGQEESYRGEGPTEATAIADLLDRLDEDDKIFCRQCKEIVDVGADEACRDPDCGAARI